MIAKARNEALPDILQVLSGAMAPRQSLGNWHLKAFAYSRAVGLCLMAMAKKRVPKAVSKYMAQIGSKGGRKGGVKGLAALLPEDRERIRAKALTARRKKLAK